MSTLASRSSPLTAIQAHVAAVLILGCLAGCAAGSCLSYGHSCWGAHGKRSGGGGVRAGEGLGLGLGAADTQWFISRLAPLPARVRQQLQLEGSPQWYPRPAVAALDAVDDQRRLNMADTGSLVLPADAESAEDVVAADDREVIIMEQPPRLFKILNHLPSKLELKTQESK